MTARLLCLLPDLDGGGAQRTMVNLANRLPGHGFDVRLAVARTGGPAGAWLEHGECLIDLGCRRTLQAIVPLRRLVDDWRPDILFSTMLDANLAAVFATLGLRRRPILVARETNSHAARGDLSRLRRMAAGWAYRRVDRLIALSRGVGQELTAAYGLEPARVQVIPNPVDVAAVFHRAVPRVRMERRPVVLGVGRLTRQKGFDLLLRAVAGLGPERPRVLLLGEGPDRQDLAGLAASLGVDLEMPGFVADPVPFMAGCDLFVLSSRWEGFGHVIVEAMAAGAPVVSFDCPYGPADIIEHGRSGVLVPAGDIGALGAAIAALLRDQGARAALAATGCQAADRFGIDRITADYARCLWDACGGALDDSGLVR